jgi:hypothetical protein
MPSWLDDAGDAVRRLTQAVSGSEVPVVPVPNRWFSDAAGNPGPQKLVERALQATGHPRDFFHSGAFVDPRTGEVLDGRSFARGAILVNPESGKPAFGVSGAMENWDPVPGAIADSNLIRRSLFRPEDNATDIPFLTAVESGGKHFYGLGARYESPVMLRNTMTGRNPTLRPRARGSVWGSEPIGSIAIRGQSHPVYSELLVAPRGEQGMGELLRYGLLAPLAAGAAASGVNEQPTP